MFLLSPAILSASICGYRQRVTDDFKDPEPPPWLEGAKKYDGKGPPDLKGRTLGMKEKGKPRNFAPWSITGCGPVSTTERPENDGVRGLFGTGFL
jgi:hypothetical protein